MIPPNVATCAWPTHRLDHALELLARQARYPLNEQRRRSVGQLGAPALADAFSPTAAWMGLEATNVTAPYAELRALLRRCGPGVVSLSADSFLVVLRCTRGRLVLVPPGGGTLRSVPVRDVESVLRDAAVAAARVRIAEPLDEVPEDQRNLVEAALMQEQMRAVSFDQCWTLRPPPSSPLWTQLRAHGLLTKIAGVAALQLVLAALAMVSWTLVGVGALEGRLEAGLLLAWGAILIVYLPVQARLSWRQGEVAVGIGRVIKQRLLWGALQLDRSTLAADGAGQLLGRALAANRLDDVASTIGLSALLNVLTLLPLIAWVGLGAGGWLHGAVLFASVAIVSGIAGQGYRAAVNYADRRRATTRELVERMLGHRTRLAQRDSTLWHSGEDAVLDEFGQSAQVVDRYQVLFAAVPYVTLLASLLVCAPAFVRGSPTTELAIAFGGCAIAFSALEVVCGGIGQFVTAAASWSQIRPLNAAAHRTPVTAEPTIALLPARAAVPHASAPVLSAQNLSFRYPSRERSVLDNVSVEVKRGERVLVEGPSGGGKSTFAALVAGLESPSEGLILLDGFDYPTLGARGWRSRIAVAAQYHDNHVFSNTFAFNALLGRQNWPVLPTDNVEVQEICAELGLDDLLQRMPGGGAQVVGETGWKLSHGERSRLFIARALLQDAPVVVLDESFAALDPATLRKSLECVLRRAETLIVVAHP